jgi:hypothetical protein
LANFGSRPQAATGNSARFAAGQGFPGGATAGRAGGSFAGRGGLSGGSVTMGQVVKNDGSTITLSLPDGSGSRLVMLSASTTVMKASVAPTSALAVGSNVAVIGAANTDGSISAQSIQVR